MNPIETLINNLKQRPWWMNCLMLFCGYMTVIYLPWDIFLKALSEDQEVWFGILFTGWAAKAGAVLHWLVYGFGKMKSWMFPWAGVYTLQISVGMLIWTAMDSRGSGMLSGIIVAIPFLALAIALWRSKLFKHNSIEPETTENET